VNHEVLYPVTNRQLETCATRKPSDLLSSYSNDNFLLLHAAGIMESMANVSQVLRGKVTMTEVLNV